MSDPIIIERLFSQPVMVEPLMVGQTAVIALGAQPGPFGPVSLAATTMAVTIGDSSNVLIPGPKADLPVNWTGTILGWALFGDLAGSAVIDILKGDPINAVPFVSIAGGNKPTLTAVAAAEGNVAGWNPNLSSGDVLRYTVQSLSTIRRLTIALFVERD